MILGLTPSGFVLLSGVPFEALGSVCGWWANSTYHIARNENMTPYSLVKFAMSSSKERDWLVNGPIPQISAHGLGYMDMYIFYSTPKPEPT
ncbi:hypothetical protein L484_021764 [Morus notabilis]|uniref:Uncharacterized protein n=1 Tax=Morus notabilis TaxID=981085 RepID=W9S720_9ROSA|nr:hypothetical protein L484_021764 [Morus notabilis]